jgi:hypothetical protein
VVEERYRRAQLDLDEVAFVDAQIGRLVYGLKKLSLYEQLSRASARSSRESGAVGLIEIFLIAIGLRILSSHLLG